MIRRIALMTAGMLLVSGLAFAQTTANATATAEIVEELSITKAGGDDLIFGLIVPAGTPGTVTVPNDGGARTVGTVTAFGAYQRATFTVDGQADKTFSVTIPASVSLISGGNNMTASLLPSCSAGCTLVGGTSSLFVGGTLAVGTNQAQGVYSGSFDVGVAYE